MNYVNYHNSIVEARRAKLVGWPKGIKFANPSDIGILKDLRILRDDLRSGKCFWKKLSAVEVDEHMAEIEERREQGEIVGKPRKKRVSKKRKRATSPESDQENEDPEPARKAKRTGKSKKTAGNSRAKAPRSVEFIDSSEEEEED